MLYFSAKVEYGLQLLIILAENQTRLSLKEIADGSHMPYHFLVKIMRELNTAGLVNAKEGKHGGYLLTRTAKKISLKEILKALNEELTLARCLARGGCHVKNPQNCRTRLVWLKIKNNIDQELQKLTLQDLINK
jgi:Rrf2 family protein